MTRYGFICIPYFSHINSMLCLAHELQRRGHDVIFFGIPDAIAYLKNSDVRTRSFADEEYPLGTSAQKSAKFAKLTGLHAVIYLISVLVEEQLVTYKYAPPVIREENVDCLVVENVASGCHVSIADHLQLPFVSFCAAMILTRDFHVPNFLSHRVHADSFFSRLLNMIEWFLITFLSRDLHNTVAKQRAEWKLSPHAWGTPNDALSPLAVFQQGCASFDFPRSFLPPQVHYIGRWGTPGNDPLAIEVAFPFEKLDGRPLVYMSLGTILQPHNDYYCSIARGCVDLNIQLVISLGRATSGEKGDIGGEEALREIVESKDGMLVSFAPQADIIPKCAAVITPCGMNTVMMSLFHGVPMVMIPMTSEQPSIAARVYAKGAGERILPGKVNEKSVEAALRKVLKDESYRDRARQIGRDLSAAGGVKKAADIMERVMRTGRVVTREEVCDEY